MVKSIQRKRVGVNWVGAGVSASFALKKVKRSGVRKGMVLVSKAVLYKAPTDKTEGEKVMEAAAVWEFDAEVVVLYHSTTIGARYQAMVHCGCVRQTAKILRLGKGEGRVKSLEEAIGGSGKDGGAGDVNKEEVQEKEREKVAGQAEGEEEGKGVLRTGDRSIVRFRYDFLVVPFFTASSVYLRCALSVQQDLSNTRNTSSLDRGYFSAKDEPKGLARLSD